MGKRSRSPSPSGSSNSGERRKKHKHKHKADKEKHKKHKDKGKKHKGSKGSRRGRGSSSPDPDRVAAAKLYLKQVLAEGGGGEAAAAAAAAVFAAEAAAAAPGKRGGTGGAGGDGGERRRKREQQARAPRPKPPGVPDIGPDDYFSKAPEFTAWLQEARGAYFSELPGEEARALFGDFVAEWNGGHLAAKFYAGLVAAPLKRTTHAWGFASQPKPGGGVAALMSDQQQQRQEARAAARDEAGRDRRKWRSEQKELLDELLPKATGREAAIEQRIARREAARAREDSPELMRVTGGGDVMGGGDSFAAAKAREAAFSARRMQRDAAKREGLVAKLSAAAAAEEAKMASFRAMVSAGPITIPKRAPPQ